MATTNWATIYGTGTANSGYLVSWRPFINWRVTGQNIANNTSTIQAYGGLQHISGTTRAIGKFNGNLIVNGVSKAIANYQTSNVNQINFPTQTFTVTHGSNGTKSVTFKLTGAVGGTNSYTGTSLSVSNSLPTIPRASIPTLSASTINLGGTLTLNTNRKSSSFTHTIQLWRSTSDGNSAVNYGNIATGVGTSYVFNSSTYSTWMAQRYPSAIKGRFWLRCITYSGSTEVGRKDIQFYVNIPDTEAYRPTLESITVSDNNGASEKLGADIYAQNFSQLKIVANGAAGVFNSTINGYRVQVGSGAPTIYSSNTVNINLTVSGSVVISVEARDTRGRFSPVRTTTITSLAYNKPSISSSVYVERADESGNPTTLGTRALVNRFSGTHSTLSVKGVSKNSRWLNARVREKGTTSWSTIAAFATGTGNWSNLSLTIGNVTTDIDKVYEVQLRAWDTMVGESGAASRVLEIPVSSTALSISKDGIGVGKIWEQSLGHALQVDGDAHISGSLHLANPNEIVIDGVAYQKSGTAELSSTPEFTKYGSYIYVRTIRIPNPFDIPEGYTFLYSPGASTGYTFIQSISNSDTDGTTCRHLQIGNDNTAATSKVRWQLIKV